MLVDGQNSTSVFDAGDVEALIAILKDYKADGGLKKIGRLINY